MHTADTDMIWEKSCQPHVAIKNLFASSHLMRHKSLSCFCKPVNIMQTYCYNSVNYTSVPMWWNRLCHIHISTYPHIITCTEVSSWLVGEVTTIHMYTGLQPACCWSHCYSLHLIFEWYLWHWACVSLFELAVIGIDCWCS